METSRRRFLVLFGAAVSVSAAVAAGIEAATSAPSTGESQTGGGVVDAGDLATYSKEDVYDNFRGDGFFIVRRDKQLFALSSVCTHKGCKVRVQDDQTYLCKCHGSRFDRDGKVTKGPANRDLPHLAVAENEQQHVLVDLNQQVKAPG